MGPGQSAGSSEVLNLGSTCYEAPVLLRACADVSLMGWRPLCRGWE